MPRLTHAVKAVIRNQAGAILFLRRNIAIRDLDNWDLPGGLVEPGEDEKVALKREIREELGVEAEIGEKVGSWSFFRPLDDKTVTVNNYEAVLLDNNITISEEHSAYVWAKPKTYRQLPVKDHSLFDALG